MYSGFLTERTAEYALVPDLSQRLSSEFARVVPFFYQASFEGQTKARSSYEGLVRLLCCYARRPKIFNVGDLSIFIKFNDLLFAHARLLQSLGVPVLAGAPCVSRLSDLQVGVRCVWFHLQPEEGYEATAQVELETLRRTDSGPPQGPLTSAELCFIARDRTNPIEWPEALKGIAGINKELQESVGYRSLFGWTVRYKPFYVALFDRAE